VKQLALVARGNRRRPDLAEPDGLCEATWPAETIDEDDYREVGAACPEPVVARAMVRFDGMPDGCGVLPLRVCAFHVLDGDLRLGLDVE
jgi:hypothetical protein